MLPLFKIKKPLLLLSILLLSVIFYIIINSSGSPNMANMIPNGDYPPPPRLGLNGVSLTTTVSGMSTNNLVN